MTAWTTPKTDWDAADALPASDLNRIETNTQYLKDHVDDTTIHQTNEEVRGDDETALILECRTSDPSTPATGRIWIRTDL